MCEAPAETLAAFFVIRSHHTASGHPAEDPVEPRWGSWFVQGLGQAQQSQLQFQCPLPPAQAKNRIPSIASGAATCKWSPKVRKQPTCGANWPLTLLVQRARTRSIQHRVSRGLTHWWFRVRKEPPPQAKEGLAPCTTVASSAEIESRTPAHELGNYKGP